MLGLEVPDDVTAERRRGSRFIFDIRLYCPKVKTCACDRVAHGGLERSGDIRLT
jgi:hypothetical protein